jgi:hypothetical protein
MQLPAAVEGKQGKCPSCSTVITITASQHGANANEIQVAPKQPVAAPASPQSVQRIQQQAPAAVASLTPQPASAPRKSRWKLLCVTHILTAALTIGLMPYWKPHLEPFFPADYLAQNSPEAITPESESESESAAFTRSNWDAAYDKLDEGMSKEDLQKMMQDEFGAELKEGAGRDQFRFDGVLRKYWIEVEYDMRRQPTLWVKGSGEEYPGITRNTSPVDVQVQSGAVPTSPYPGDDKPSSLEMADEGGFEDPPPDDGESQQEAISSLEEVKRKDTATPEKLLAAYFAARSMDERLLYVADREKDEASMREHFKDKDWDSPSTFSFISMDEVSPSETKVLFSLYFAVIWEVMLKKEEGNFGFDYSTQKINLGVKIAGLKEFPGVDAGIFFSNPRTYSNKLVRLDAVKLMSSAHDIQDDNKIGTKFGSIFVRAENDNQGLHDRTVYLDTTRFPKLEEGDVASFIATVKITDGKQYISLVEMIDGSYEPAPVQVSIERLEVFGKDYVGKTVRFSNVRYCEIESSTDELIRFKFNSKVAGDFYSHNLANKKQWAEFLLSLEYGDRINVEGEVGPIVSGSEHSIRITLIERVTNKDNLK